MILLKQSYKDSGVTGLQPVGMLYNGFEIKQSDPMLAPDDPENADFVMTLVEDNLREEYPDTPYIFCLDLQVKKHDRHYYVVVTGDLYEAKTREPKD